MNRGVVEICSCTSSVISTARPQMDPNIRYGYDSLKLILEFGPFDVGQKAWSVTSAGIAGIYVDLARKRGRNPRCASVIAITPPALWPQPQHTRKWPLSPM